MKVVICDDDAAFCDLFSRMLEEQFTAKQWPFDYVVFTSGQALLVSDLTDVQIVFLDIDMPGVNGMEAAHQLREKSKELIGFPFADAQHILNLINGVSPFSNRGGWYNLFHDIKLLS